MSDEITVNVRSMDDKKESVSIRPTDLVSKLKEIVYTKFQVSVEEQLLLFRGRVLKDDQTISSCNINPNDTVLLVIHKHEEPEPEQPPHVNPVPQLTEPVLRAFDRRLSGAANKDEDSLRHNDHG